MRRAVALGLAVLLAAPVRSDDLPGVPALMQAAVEAYREGRSLDALHDMALALEQEPDNATAKNYVWTIARKLAQEDARDVLKRGEAARAEALALHDLEERRVRARAVLGALKDASARTDSPRGPSDLLSGVAGLDRFLGAEFEAERADAQAKAYLRNILANLSAAIDRRAFVSSKDFFRAQGYLAYYQHKWSDAVGWWEKAAREDADDAALRRDLDALRGLITRKKEEKELQDLAAQAEAYYRTGYLQESLDAWQQVYRWRPDYPGAREKLAVARVAVEKGRQAEELRRRTDEGVAAFKAGGFLKAAQIWLEVLQTDPSYDRARTWLKLVGPKLEGAASAPLPAPVPAGPAAAKPGAAAASPAEASKAEDFYKRGLLLYADDKIEQAVGLWKECLRLNPGLDKARQALEHAERELAFH